jgi:Tfp pilus assembly protein PilO
MKQVMALLTRVPARQLNMLLCGVLLIVAALAWSIGIQKPLMSWRVTDRERARLTSLDTNPGASDAQHKALVEQVARLTHDLHLDEPQRHPDELLLSLISEADRSARRHDIQLGGAVPGPVRKLVIFEEISFDVNAQGSYQSLMDWIADLEQTFAALAVLHFRITPSTEPSRLNMRVRVAAYKPLEQHP